MIETARGEEDRVRLTVRRSIQINRSQRNCRGVKNLMETSASCSTHIRAKAPSRSISGIKRAHNVLMAKKRKGRKHIKVSTKLNFWKFATRYTRINEENCFRRNSNFSLSYLRNFSAPLRKVSTCDINTWEAAAWARNYRGILDNVMNILRGCNRISSFNIGLYMLTNERWEWGGWSPECVMPMLTARGLHSD